MELWTPEHIRTLLPSLGVMLLVAVALRILLINKPLKIRLIPFQVLACIIVALEIGKQGLSLAQGYDLYYLPFHFCSLFIFVLPAMSFYKGKHTQTVYAITAGVSAAMFLLMLIYPNLIYGANNILAYTDEYISFHTVTFHNIVMMEFLLILLLELHTPANCELRALTFFTIGFCVVAATMAQLLKTNYANFYSCNIPVLEAVKNTMVGVLGAFWTQVLYVLIVATLHVLFVMMSYGLYRLARKAIRHKAPLAL